MTAETPAARQVSTPSAKGKKASDAQTAPTDLAPACSTASRRALDAVHLAGTDADEGAIAREHDGVRLDVPDDAPGEGKVGQLARVRLTRGSPCATAPDHRAAHPRPTAAGRPPRRATSREGRGRPRDGGVLEQAQVGLGGQDLKCPCVEPGRDDDLQEEARQLPCQRPIDHAAYGHDAPECAHRIGLRARAPRRSPDHRPRLHRRGCRA